MYRVAFSHVCLLSEAGMHLADQPSLRSIVWRLLIAGGHFWASRRDRKYHERWAWRVPSSS